MALTESNEFAIGTKAPDFKLINTVDGVFVSLEELKGSEGTVIMFICNHCPFVIHINDELVNIANEYKSRGDNFIAISSNEIDNYPQDGPKFMKKVALKLDYSFPYLFDETQQVAKSYSAACTPDFYVFDANLISVYHGQLDDSRPSNGLLVSGKDIRTSLDNIILKKPAIIDQKPSMGCGIKWR